MVNEGSKFSRLISRCAVVAAIGLFAGGSSAAIVHNGKIYTEFKDPRSAEATHQQILEQLYGGTFQSTGAHGLDFVSDQFYVQRIADDREQVQVATAIGQTNGDLTQYTDQFWQDQFESVNARARFASYGQAFGYYPQAEDGTYEELFEVKYDHGFDPDQSAEMPDLGGETFRWARGGENGVWNSDPAQNWDGKDHLITYKVMLLEQDLPENGVFALQQVIDPIKTFLLFWEDQSDTGNLNDYDKGDWDFNDLVVEVHARYNEVPEPTIGMTIMGLVGLLGMRRRR